MKEKTSGNTDELAQKVEELKKEFVDLTKEQRELLLCRKIIETGKVINNSQGFSSFTYNQGIDSDQLLCLIKAADVGFLKPLIMLYNA